MRIYLLHHGAASYQNQQPDKDSEIDLVHYFYSNYTFTFILTLSF